MPYPTDRERDRPWVIRTYAGHSSAAKSNELYRRNLAKGQTGLSVAFDLPTQTGYDPDDELARGEVGKVGVPVSHLGDMRTLFDGIPLSEANTSMTINAPAMWLLALYVAVAEEQGADRAQLVEKRFECTEIVAVVTVSHDHISAARNLHTAKEGAAVARDRDLDDPSLGLRDPPSLVGGDRERGSVPERSACRRDHRLDR